MSLYRYLKILMKASIPVATVILMASTGLAKDSGPLRGEVGSVVIHATGGPMCRDGRVVFTPSGTLRSMKRYFENHSILGIHYIIGRDGTIVKSVPEDQIAYHAYGHNKTSIGIELINRGDGHDPYPESQIVSLIELLKEIRTRHNIKIEDINGHSDLDHRTFQCGSTLIKQKQDPGPNFPWERVTDQLSRPHVLTRKSPIH
jgi:N-acetyl-anhydromuramyl-L-alanine amidase AmpD